MNFGIYSQGCEEEFKVVESIDKNSQDYESNKNINSNSSEQKGFGIFGIFPFGGFSPAKRGSHN